MPVSRAKMLPRFHFSTADSFGDMDHLLESPNCRRFVFPEDAYAKCDRVFEFPHFAMRQTAIPTCSHAEWILSLSKRLLINALLQGRPGESLPFPSASRLITSPSRSARGTFVVFAVGISGESNRDARLIESEPNARMINPGIEDCIPAIIINIIQLSGFRLTMPDEADCVMNAHERVIA